MKKQKLILIGGGGHCKACIDVIEQTNQYEILGILDRQDLVGTAVLGYKIIGTDKDMLTYLKDDCQFFVTIGQIKSASNRNRIFELLIECGAEIATIISPKAYVSKYAKVGVGTVIMHNVIVNASSTIGKNCILNTGCDIEHDTAIGNHTHISTNATINGGCIIGNCVFVGSNATIANQVTLGDNIIIGAGSVVIQDVLNEGIYLGNPAKKLN